jgi:hypothetical protein
MFIDMDLDCTKFRKESKMRNMLACATILLLIGSIGYAVGPQAPPQPTTGGPQAPPQPTWAVGPQAPPQPTTGGPQAPPQPTWA